MNLKPEQLILPCTQCPVLPCYMVPTQTVRHLSIRRTGLYGEHFWAFHSSILFEALWVISKFKNTPLVGINPIKFNTDVSTVLPNQPLEGSPWQCIRRCLVWTVHLLIVPRHLAVSIGREGRQPDTNLMSRPHIAVGCIICLHHTNII